jgi:hypothetical protein
MAKESRDYRYSLRKSSAQNEMDKNEKVCFTCDLQADDCYTKRCHLKKIFQSNGRDLHKSTLPTVHQDRCGVPEWNLD